MINFLEKISDFFTNKTIGKADPATAAVVARQSKTAYWKNYNGFGKNDLINFDGYTRAELTSFMSEPKTKKSNLLDLVMNPALPSVEFNLKAILPTMNPDISIDRISNRYKISEDNRTIDVYEVAKIYIRQNYLREDQRIAKDKANAEGILVVLDDGEKVWYEPIILNQSEFFSSSRSTLVPAVMMYAAVQFAFKNRPAVFREVTEIKHCSSGAHKSKNCKSSVPVRHLVLDHKELNELMLGHYTPAKREIKCSAWGVSGHWRHYKNGKVVWVRPYVKGKDRHKPEAYIPKTYELPRK